MSRKLFLSTLKQEDKKRDNRSMLPTVKKFTADKGGLAAIEFSLFILIFVVMILGGFTVFDFSRANKSLKDATTTVVDLATRVNEIDDVQRDDFIDAARAILGRYNDPSFSMVISSVANSLSDGKDVTEVVWSETLGTLPPLTDGGLPSLNVPLLQDGQSAIIIQSTLDHGLFLAVGSLPKTISLNDSAVRIPRFVSQICYRTSSPPPNDLICLQ